ncbi:MAG: hypothetical protein DCF15_08785 [Phormidesmis priestleyi]|uniref:Uncharacterized protein n=1 Tax=Phormidesmis priestleyi TaxID=268141 RepID=A0A2W4XGR0_9CYAN|nr:MAG: hypothetical protein DCF15_08785 [Phormidesmis priestleyi]
MSVSYGQLWLWLATMTQLLLTIYFLVVFYVLYKMALGLEERKEAKVIINVDEKFLAEQTVIQLSRQIGGRAIKASVEKFGFGKKKDPVLSLAFEQAQSIPIPPKDLEKKEKDGMTPPEVSQWSEQWSKERVSIQVLPIGEEKLGPVWVMKIDVKNKTRDQQVYLDWDRSSIEIGGRANRVIRSTSNVFRDLSQPQIFGVVNPGGTVLFLVNIEGNYTRDIETNRLKPPLPLEDLKQRADEAKLTDPTAKEKNIEPLYNLDLMVRMKRTDEKDSEMINLLIPFAFTLEIKVDPPAFPPLRWFLRNFGPNRESNWLWGVSKKDVA